MKLLKANKIATFMAFFTFTVVWQSCEPPPMFSCVSDALFTTSTSISYNESNHMVTFRVREPFTCGTDLYAEQHCNQADFQLTMDIYDCNGNHETLVKTVSFINVLDDVFDVDWQIDSNGGNVLGDQSVIFTLQASSLSGPLGHIDLRVDSNIYQWQGCYNANGTPGIGVGHSLNFYLMDGTTTPPSINVFENEYFQDAHHMVYKNVFADGC